MRIAVLGDFHLAPNEQALHEAAMDDIAACKPDLVVPLGDFGTGKHIGSPEGLMEAHALLRRIGAPMRPILGNHDWQRESGGGPQVVGTMERLLMRLFELDAPYGVIEKETFRLFFVATEYQSPDICYQVQECYTSDKQFVDVQAWLKQRPGVPAVVFSHAPPVGCKLRTVPNTHVRATNAYLSQNHEPKRWLHLVQEHPEIVLWFSAHYHLGHGHPDSLSHRFGTWFFTTGVHGPATRDGSRQSRVIDIEPDRVVVRTLCHDIRGFDDALEWVHPGPLRALVVADKPAEKTGGSGSAVAFPVESVSRSASASAARVNCKASAPVVGATPVPGGMAYLRDELVLLATDEGFAWEVDLDCESVMGTLHLDDPLRHVCASGTYAWLADVNRLAYVSTGDPWRFVRSKGGTSSARWFRFDAPIDAMVADGQGGVFVATGRALRRLNPVGNGAEEPQSVHGVGSVVDRGETALDPGAPMILLPDTAAHLAFDDVNQQLWLIDVEGRLWMLNVAGADTSGKQQTVSDVWTPWNGQDMVVLGSGSGSVGDSILEDGEGVWEAWDVRDGKGVGILRRNEAAHLLFVRGKEVEVLSLPVCVSRDDAAHAADAADAAHAAHAAHAADAAQEGTIKEDPFREEPVSRVLWVGPGQVVALVDGGLYFCDGRFHPRLRRTTTGPGVEPAGNAGVAADETDGVCVEPVETGGRPHGLCCLKSEGDVSAFCVAVTFDDDPERHPEVQLWHRGA